MYKNQNPIVIDAAQLPVVTSYDIATAQNALILLYDTL